MHVVQTGVCGGAVTEFAHRFLHNPNPNTPDPNVLLLELMAVMSAHR